MFDWDRVFKDRITPEDFIAVIEIPKGSKQKYEIDAQSGMLILDRILFTSTHYPANYGFIPNTYAADGDPLDVLVFCSESLYPMSTVQCYPIGGILMLDENVHDEKILAVPFNDPQMAGYKDLADLPGHLFEEIQHFFTIYKELEGKETAIVQSFDAAKAKEVIQACYDLYQARQVR